MAALELKMTSLSMRLIRHRYLSGSTTMNQTAQGPLPARQSEHFNRTLVVVVAMMTAVIVYGVVALLFIRAKSPTFSPEQIVLQADWARWIYGFAFLVSLAVILLRRTWFNPQRLFSIASQHGADALPAHFASRTIILCVMSEMVALGGLILGVLTHKMEPMWRLGAVSLLLMGFLLPRRNAWLNTIDNFSRAVQDN